MTAGEGVDVDPLVLQDLWFRAQRRFARALRSDGAAGMPSLTQLELMDLLESQGTLSLMHAAERLGVTGATAVRAVEAAVRRGWIEKMRDPQDRRVVWLRTTPAGLSAREAARRVMARRLQAMLEGATAEELAIMARLLGIMAGWESP
jgi:DNA-binding MarR family transcriptional regulator